jgi:hypothetical protein
MGSIQGLRSEAVALRAKSDTDLQISQHLGGVNKSLGSQLTGIIDQLQGVITERTKAYNASMLNLARTINGKDAIGSRGMQVVFGIVGFAFDVIKMIKDGGNVAGVIAAAFDAIKIVSDTVALRYNINSAVYDYEKGASQLGYTNITPQNSSLPSASDISADPGASQLINLKNSIMPSYKSYNQRLMNNGYMQTYIGALKKR